MTTEIEKTFFDTFEIKSIKRGTCSTAGDCPDGCIVCDTCEHWRIIREDYPEITDRILLELLVIITRYTDIIEGFDSLQELKEFVLKDLMYSLTQPECNIVKQQVQSLFKAVKNA